jgi:Fic family protein
MIPGTRTYGIYIQKADGSIELHPTPIPLEDPPFNSITESIPDLLEEVKYARKTYEGFRKIVPDWLLGMLVLREQWFSFKLENSQITFCDVLRSMTGGTDVSREVSDILRSLDITDFSISKSRTMGKQDIPFSLKLVWQCHRLLAAEGEGRGPGLKLQDLEEIEPAVSKERREYYTVSNYAPPTGRGAELSIEELQRYINSNALNPFIDYGLILYQFEAISPFKSMTGVMARLLGMMFLAWRGLIEKPILGMNETFFRYQDQEDAYFRNIENVKEKGSHEVWVAFVLRCLIEAVDCSISTAKRILEFQEEKRKTILQKKTKSILLIRYLDELFQCPCITKKHICEKLDISLPAASSLTKEFEADRILRRQEGKGGKRLFLFQEYIDLLKGGKNGTLSL